MSEVAGQYDLTDLLERASARIRGNRADCPWCGRKRSVSFDESKGVYHCHGAGCDFSGNTVKLAREQGLTTRLTAAEYHELCQKRELADRAARALYERVKARRFELLDYLHVLGDLEATAHRLGPDNPETWDALSAVYADRPAILAKLTILENAGAADLLRFLAANPETQKRVIDGVRMRGGLTDDSGKFVGVAGA